MAVRDEPVRIKSHLSATELADLDHVSNLLHLAHHRNKNQHRRASFYRHFSLFRRRLSKMVDLYTTLSHVPDTHTARHRKKAEDRATLSLVQGEVDFLARILVPKCEHAFGQLVADLRFGVLGVVLLAILAQSCALLGINAWYEYVAEHEVQEVLQRFEREEWGHTKVDAMANPASVEDVGEVVHRDEEPQKMGVVSLTSMVANTIDDENDDEKLPKQRRSDVHINGLAKNAKKRSLPDEPVKKKKKKKKKTKKNGGDAIDDLFAGL
ncbi:hypothetical protein ANO11243_048640 [Dothideomycetidae sp. 11243]|nr:hypothetical protein ANO11243_048640 [fungal sp. No.11243]